MRLLILGGTTEASRLAAALSERTDVEATVSLAGRTAAPSATGLPMRIGGFGGVDGLTGYLARETIAAVVDATHPFAARISAHAVAACGRAGVPLLAYSRDPWQPGEGDRWTDVADIAGAVAYLEAQPPRRVMLTTGRLDLASFRAADQHWYLARTIDAPVPADCPSRMELVLGRGPFAVADEAELMRSHAIDLLVTKNSGGAASAAKLAAARDLALPVLMVARPVVPPRETVERLDDVLAWITRHAAPR